MFSLTEIKPGAYILAVSGGIDSMVLLHRLGSNLSRGSCKFHVAYVDHGWRDTTAERQLVKRAAQEYSLPFHYLKLGLKGVGEAEARKGRYQALEELRQNVGADALMTAHHLDDRIETLLLNIMRGTGVAGLSPLHSRERLVRPLLKTQRNQIEAYAAAHKLKWIEDPTNADTLYRRNYIRNQLIPAMVAQDSEAREQLYHHLKQLDHNHVKITTAVETLWKTGGEVTQQGIQFPLRQLRRHDVLLVQELLVYMSRRAQPDVQLDARTIEALAVAIKTGRILQRKQLAQRLFVEVSHGTVTITFIASQKH